MSSYDEAKLLKEIISSVADSSVKSGKTPTLRIGTVVSYVASTNLATIYLAGDDAGNTSTFLNKSGQNLQANDTVYILVLDGSLSNSFIAWRKGTYGVTYNGTASGDVAIASANTWYTGASVTLPPGKYLVTGHITCLRNTTTEVRYSARISTGSVHYASAGMYMPSVANNIATMAMSTVVTLTTTTTLNIQATATQTATIKAALVSNGAGNNATQINAIPIA